jgi:HD-GYP domain-containing protein (c-di-GMP phosphodiesterase class II)
MITGPRALPRPRLDARIVAVVTVTAVAAVSMEAVWIAAWRGPVYGDVSLLAVLLLLAAAATHFPVEFTAKFKTNTATAVYFAILLLYPPPVAVAAVGVAVLAGNASLALRRNASGAPMRGVYDTAFNVAQTMIAIGIAATVLYSLGPAKPVTLLTVSDLWAVPAAAASLYLATTVLVSAVVSLQLFRRPWDVWLSTQRIDIPAEASLYLIGFVTAVLAAGHPWAPLIMVIPTAVVYLSTKRAVQLQEQTIAAVEAMADIVDKRDPYTAEHSRRVAANVTLIAAEMGLSREDVTTIRLAARVHDLGKIALPDSILSKPGRLTGGEFTLMKAHPQLGYDILAKFPLYRRGREIVLAHHERIDGKGYPRGLAGNRIPLGARILAVADALDAMTSNRPYRPAFRRHQAMTELRLGRGTQWSAEVVDAVDRLLDVPQPQLAFAATSAASVAATA